MNELREFVKKLEHRFMVKPEPISGEPSTVQVPTSHAPDAQERAELRTPAPSLKGRAVELWRAGDRLFVVSDEADARIAMERFAASRGEIWTRAEVEVVATIREQSARDEVAAFKRQLNGSLSVDKGTRGTKPEQWQADSLNRLFLDQGSASQPAKITAQTVKHGASR